MKRQELVDRLANITQIHTAERMRERVNDLIADINEEGVLDIQQPPALIDVQRIRDRGHVTLEELSAMTLQDIATFSR